MELSSHHYQLDAPASWFYHFTEKHEEVAWQEEIVYLMVLLYHFKIMGGSVQI